MNRKKITLKLSETATRAFVTHLENEGLLKQVKLVSPEIVDCDFSLGRRPLVDLVVCGQPGTMDSETYQFLLRAHLAGIPVMDQDHCLASFTKRISTEQFDVLRFVSFAVKQTFSVRFFRFVKAVIEPVVALGMLVMLSPLFVMIALAVRISSVGQVIFRQSRTGYMGRTFTLYKFRTMSTDSEADGWQWSRLGDPRVTGLGKLLRKTRLDELPQLWNVVRGEMGFIGPRPERPEIYKELVPQIPHFNLRTLIRPGITGLAQVCSGYASTVEESKIKLEHDLYYIQNISPLLDLAIVFMTLKVILFGQEFRRPSGLASAIVEISTGDVVSGQPGST